MPHLMRAPCIPHTSLIVVGRVERHVPIRFTNAAESFLVHLVAWKRAHHSNSSVLQLPSAGAVHSPKQLVVAVTVCSTPTRSCCILPLILLFTAPPAGADNTQHAIQLLTCLPARQLQLLSLKSSIMLQQSACTKRDTNNIYSIFHF